MENIALNIKFLREEAGFTQQDLADRLEVSRVLVTGYEQGRITPPIPVALEIARLFSVDLDGLVGRDIWRKDKSRKQSTGKEVLAITVDSANNENVELVNQKASAGYLNGYSDVEYLKDLPKINVPGLSKSSTHRGFEIKGDSMLPVRSGDIIIGRYVDSISDIKNGKTYVVLSRTEGIVYKRVFSVDRDLLMISDNRAYEPYVVPKRDVIEVWSFKSRITFDDEIVEQPSITTLDFLATKFVEANKKK